MQKTFGDKLEVTIGVTYNWGRWGLPLAIGIWRTEGVSMRNIDISLDILCIRLFIDVWRWK